MTRIGTPAAALMTLALLTSACGGGSGGGSKDTAPTAAQATAAAKAINLVQGDVGAGFTGSAHGTSGSTDEQVTKDVASCLKVDPKVLDKTNTVSKASSQDYEKGQTPNSIQVSSTVEVLTSTAIAKRQLAIYQDDKTAGCLSTAFDKAFRSSFGDTKGVTLGKIAIKKIDVDASGTDGAFGYSISLPLSGGGQSFNVTSEIYGFLDKHTQVTLETSSFGQSFPASTKDDLYGKLVERAKKSAV
ncbi:MAG: hypothetical protein JWO22_2439 [Frankiales bacterium]|nr:hypothetical protein [Frankiales bacterium]